MSPRQASRKKSSNGIGCLIWLALFLFICLLFFINRGRIEKVLANTDFVNLLRSRSPGPKASAEPVALSPRPSPAQSSPRRSQRPEPTPEPSGEEGQMPERTRAPSPSQAAAESPKPKMRVATLCFVRVEDDGSIVRKEVKRSLPTSDSPLQDSLNALMKGPTADEMNQSLMTLVPQGSKVLSVTMRGTTAIVNFNEAFMFNSLGVEGYAGQLKQVVWTCTAFSTVHDVQIKIEGKMIDYMGGEGVYIGVPLSRNSFGSL